MERLSELNIPQLNQLIVAFIQRMWLLQVLHTNAIFDKYIDFPTTNPHIHRLPQIIRRYDCFINYVSK